MEARISAERRGAPSHDGLRTALLAAHALEIDNSRDKSPAALAALASKHELATAALEARISADRRGAPSHDGLRTALLAAHALEIDNSLDKSPDALAAVARKHELATAALEARFALLTHDGQRAALLAAYANSLEINMSEDERELKKTENAAAKVALEKKFIKEYLCHTNTTSNVFVRRKIVALMNIDGHDAASIFSQFETLKYEGLSKASKKTHKKPTTATTPSGLGYAALLPRRFPAGQAVGVKRHRIDEPSSAPAPRRGRSGGDVLIGTAISAAVEAPRVSRGGSDW